MISGHMLRKLRLTCGWSQLVFSFRIGVPYLKLSKMERGLIPIPKTVELAARYEIENKLLGRRT